MSRGQGFGLSAAARLALVQRLARRREGQEAQAASDQRGFGAIQNLRDWELVHAAAPGAAAAACRNLGSRQAGHPQHPSGFGGREPERDQGRRRSRVHRGRRDVASGL